MPRCWVLPKANAEENGLEVCLQVREMEIDANFFFELQLHAEFLNHGDFAESDFDGLAQADDAVGGEASGKIAAFKEGNAVAGFGELTGAGKAGGSRTDDRDGFARGPGDGEELNFFAVNVVHGVALQAADGDGLVLGAENAGAFT